MTLALIMSVLMLAVGMYVRMGVNDVAVLVTVGVDQVGAQQQFAIGEDLLRRAAGG